MININIKINQKDGDIIFKMYDDMDSGENTEGEQNMCEDIYDVVYEYFYGQEAQDAIDEITSKMKEQQW